MGRVKSFAQFSNVKTEDLGRFLSLVIDDIINQINGNITFNENISCYGPVSIVFSNSNTDTVINHNLGRVPVGFIPINFSAAMNLYQGDTAWTNKTFSLKASSTGTAKVILI